MKVINNKTKREYTISDEAWKKIQLQNKAGRYRVIAETKAFVPRELKVETKDLKKEETKKSE